MAFKNLYLIAFNAVSFVGWSYIQCICLSHLAMMLMTNSTAASTHSLYSKTIIPITMLQSMQWIELLHTLLKLTKSNLVIQICQLGGRYNALMLTVLFSYFNAKHVVSPESYCNDYLQWGYTSLVFAWSIAEVIRYPFYLCKLLNKSAALTEWLRYNAFIVLYPIGFAAEMRCWYGLIKLLSMEQHIGDVAVNYQYSMPNAWNFQISLKAWAMTVFSLTPFVGYYMYAGMFSSRRKYMKSKKQD